MPTYRITDPNTGKILRVTGDSPPTEAELEQIFAAQAPAQPRQEEKPAQPTFAEALTGQKGEIAPEAAQAQGAGLLEPLATIGTSMVAEPIAGLAGLATAPFVGTTEAAKNIEATRQALTYTPRSEAGKEGLKTIGEVLKPVGEALEYIPSKMSEFTFELTGSPELATAVYTAPAAIVEYLGLRKLQTIRKGTRLLDASGKPTKALRKALDKEGLSFDSLTPEAKAKIPEIAGPELLPGANLPAKSAEKAIVEQIKSGGRDDALAGLKVVNGRVGVDKAAKEAMRQGFEPGMVQMVKTATPETKRRMLEMSNIMQAVKKNRSITRRPTDVAGKAITNRIDFITKKADDARMQLNNIAKNKLLGKEIDTTPVVKTLEQALDDLNVQLVGEGKPSAVFKGSQIAKDRTSQRVINDVIDLLSEGGKPDALRAHNLKRQLDTMLDYRKKGTTGLTDAGKKVAKQVRAALNEVVRDVDPQYAKVNDVLHKSITALEDLDKATGQIQITGRNVEAGLGTRLRTLTSNYSSRQQLMNAIEGLDDTVAGLGGKFKDNVYDLVQFANQLDERFGAVAKSSLQAEIQKGVQSMAQQGARETLRARAAEAAGRGAEKLRGINDFNAFEAMNSLLRGQ